MKTFIDFVNAAAKDAKLGADAFAAIQAGDVGRLVTFFKDRGYTVTEAEAQMLIDNKKYYQASIQREAMGTSY